MPSPLKGHLISRRDGRTLRDADAICALACSRSDHGYEESEEEEKRCRRESGPETSFWEACQIGTDKSASVYRYWSDYGLTRS